MKTARVDDWETVPLLGEADIDNPRGGIRLMLVKENVVEVGEFRVNTATAGEGGAHLVMLHGSEPGASWRDWEPLVAPLAEKFSLIIPDLIGYGKSSRPSETPRCSDEAGVVRELIERIGVREAGFVGVSWGGQVALEVALRWPSVVSSLVLVSSTYDKSQIPRLHAVKTPTLIVWALDDMVTQAKGAYVLRDAIRTSRLEMFDAAAKDPGQDSTAAHKLPRHRSEELVGRIERFLARPADMIREPPEMEHELKGIALKELEEESKKGKDPQS